MERLFKILATAACAVMFVMFSSVSAFAGGDGGGGEYVYCPAGLQTADIVLIVLFLVLPGVVTLILWLVWAWHQKVDGATFAVMAAAALAIVGSVALSIFIIFKTAAAPYEAGECGRGWMVLLAAAVSGLFSLLVPLGVAEGTGVEVFHDSNNSNN